MTIGLNEKERATLAQYGICDICIENARIQPLYDEDGERRDLFRSNRGDVLPPDLRQALEKHPKFFSVRTGVNGNSSVRIFEEMCRMMDLMAACVLAYDKSVATGNVADAEMARRIQRIAGKIRSLFSSTGPDRSMRHSAAETLTQCAVNAANHDKTEVDLVLAPILSELDEARHPELFEEEPK